MTFEAWVIIDKRTNSIVKYDLDSYSCDDCGNGTNKIISDSGEYLAIFNNEYNAKNVLNGWKEAHVYNSIKKRMEKEIIYYIIEKRILEVK